MSKLMQQSKHRKNKSVFQNDDGGMMMGTNVMKSMVETNKKIVMGCCSTLFDLSINLTNAKEMLGNAISEEEKKRAKILTEVSEAKFLSYCSYIKQYCESTRTLIPEVDGLLQYMNAIYQKHYHTSDDSAKAYDL